MLVNPYLNFSGDREAAFRFDAESLWGAAIMISRDARRSGARVLGLSEGGNVDRFGIPWMINCAAAGI